MTTNKKMKNSYHDKTRNISRTLDEFTLQERVLKFERNERKGFDESFRTFILVGEPFKLYELHIRNIIN